MGAAQKGPFSSEAHCSNEEAAQFRFCRAAKSSCSWNWDLIFVLNISEILHMQMIFFCPSPPRKTEKSRCWSNLV